MAAETSGGQRSQWVELAVRYALAVHPAFLLDRTQQFVGGELNVLIAAGLGGLYNEISRIGPVRALEMTGLEILGQRVIGSDQLRHAGHRSALRRNEVCELLVPMHSSPPPRLRDTTLRSQSWFRTGIEFGHGSIMV